MKWFVLPVLGALAWFAAPASAQPYRYHAPSHQRYHDDLEHRGFHRYLEHRDVHRYPMTWWQHGRLHDRLDHDAYHDRLEHRDAHRGYYQPRFPGYRSFPRWGHQH